MYLASSPAPQYLALHWERRAPRSAGEQLCTWSYGMSQTMGPYVTYFRRVHRISGYVGSCTWSPHLPQYTATWQYAMVHCSVSHLTSSAPHRMTQTWIPTGTYLWRCHRISGYVGSCTWPRLLLRSTLHYTGNAEHHVAQASSSVPGPTGCHRPWDPM